MWEKTFVLPQPLRRSALPWVETKDIVAVPNEDAELKRGQKLVTSAFVRRIALSKVDEAMVGLAKSIYDC